MKVMTLGGGNEVGASCVFLEIDEHRLFIDCGIRVGAGPGEDPLPDLDKIKELGGVQAGIATHAHLDHTGALPLIHQKYPNIPILATEPTIHLTQVLLADSIRIMQLKQEQEDEIPLYNAALVEKLFRRLIPVAMDQEIRIPGTDLHMRFYPGGHILGAALAEIKGKEGSVVITGDISSAGQHTIPGMKASGLRSDVLVLESTYGNREHADRAKEEERLIQKVNAVIARGGKVLIPAFALGRSQEVILILQAYQQKGLLQPCPVFIDGMIKNICDIYTRFPDQLQSALASRVNHSGNPFFSRKGLFQAVRQANSREKIAKGDPCVIVSSSGMLSGGPSQYYAAQLATEEKNAILLTGYQDEEAPGRRLMDLAQKKDHRMLLLDDIRVEVKCQVDQYGLSAHADAQSLATLAKHIGSPSVLLVHGDRGARETLAQNIQGSLLPQNGELFEFEGNGHGIAATQDEDATPQKVIPKQQVPNPTPRRLWLKLQEQGKSEAVVTVSELAMMWYGEASPQTVDRLDVLLKQDTTYFDVPWQTPYSYEAKSSEQVDIAKRRRALMKKKALIKDHLIILRDAASHIVPGICYEVDREGLEVWKAGKTGTHHFPEEVVEIIGPWSYETKEAGDEKTRLSQLMTQARAKRKQLDPADIWDKLQKNYPEGARLRQIAALFDQNDDLPFLLMLALRLHRQPVFSRTVESFDHITYKAIKTDEPIKPDKDYRLEQNAALALVDVHLPAASGLYRKGVNSTEGCLLLSFNFPSAAKEAYQEAISQLQEESGWTIQINDRVNQAAIKDAALDVLPDGQSIQGEPSYRPDTGEVKVDVIGESCDEAAWETIQSRFLQQTGLTLIPVIKQSSQDAAAAVSALSSSDDAMEINQAFTLIESMLTRQGATLYRKSKKTDSTKEFIELAFVTPEVGKRYADTIQDLSQKTGWTILISQTANQHALKNLARELVGAIVDVAKEPSFFGDRQTVLVKVKGEGDMSRVKEEFFERTGYALEVERA